MGNEGEYSTDKVVPVRERRRSLSRDDTSAATIAFVSAGQTLAGRYRLSREVARGGMGVIYEAFDEKLEDHRVAIKVLPPEMASNAKARARLRKEALAAISLTHPNILRLHSFEEDDQTVFLVMEYLDGETLEAATAEQPLPLAEVVEIARQVCPALDYAHQRGVIHRDIKPANLMYHHDGDRQIVKITDFGIAFQIRDSMTRLTGLESAGTLSYVAPEQLRGDRPDPRSDLYSLAASLYELLSGDPPFIGPALSQQILGADVSPIEDLPAYVNAALERALAKSPDERFSSMADFMRALTEPPPIPVEASVPQSTREHDDITPTEETPRGRVPTDPEGHPLFVAIVLLVIAFLAICGILLGGYLYYRAESESLSRLSLRATNGHSRMMDASARRTSVKDSRVARARYVPVGAVQ